MPRTLNVVVPVVLLLSALILSACATKPEAVPVAEPARVEVAAEMPSAPAVAPAPAVIAEQPAFVAEPAPRKGRAKGVSIAIIF